MKALGNPYRRTLREYWVVPGDGPAEHAKMFLAANAAEARALGWEEWPDAIPGWMRIVPEPKKEGLTSSE
jgi:hypothetical protein